MAAQCLEGRNHLVTISMSSMVLIAALTFSLAQAHGSDGRRTRIKGPQLFERRNPLSHRCSNSQWSSGQ